MIGIDRGDEPAALRRERRTHLSRVLLAWMETAPGVHRPDHPSLDAGYDVARDALFLAQNKKCAYCERRSYKTNNSVEHVRPRRGANPNLRDEQPARPTDETRSWWLAWTWENLLFACGTCNCTANKGNRLPFLAGGDRLPAPPRALADEQALALSFDLGMEDAGRMLVDPSRDDPQAHLVWRAYRNRQRALPTDPAKELDWRAEGLTARGWSTIWALGLDEDATDAVNEHLTRSVWRRARTVREAAAAGDDVRVASAWAEAIAELFDATASYHAASWCALAFWVDAATRAQWALADPAFPRVTPAPPARVFDDEATAALIAKIADLRLRLRVRGFSPASVAETRALLTDLQAGGDWTEDELASLLELSAATIRRHLAA